MTTNALVVSLEKDIFAYERMLEYFLNFPAEDLCKNKIIKKSLKETQKFISDCGLFFESTFVEQIYALCKKLECLL